MTQHMCDLDSAKPLHNDCKNLIIKKNFSNVSLSKKSQPAVTDLIKPDRIFSTCATSHQVVHWTQIIALSLN